MKDDLSGLDAESLRRRYVDMVLRHEQTQHIGRKNRIFGWEREIGDRLVAVGGAAEVTPLLQHPSEAVRLAAAYLIKPFDPGLFVGILEALAPSFTEAGLDARFALARLKEQPDQPAASSVAAEADPNWLRILHWQEANPPPPAMSRVYFQDRTLTEFTAGRARQLLALVRPAIGLWPQRKAPLDDRLSSRHGGQVWGPPDWNWPIYEEEPMYFLGQIKCRELTGLPSAERLPHEGLLAFFGDYDVISGCFPGGDPDPGRVCHWAEETAVAKSPPLPVAEEYLREYGTATHLVFRPFLDLPDPFSALVGELALDAEERQRYDALRDAARRHGIPDDVAPHCHYDKLLGWPDLVQQDFDLPQVGENAYRLLAQLPGRMGPGGLLYFFIREDDLAQGRFDRCVLEAQNT